MSSPSDKALRAIVETAEDQIRLLREAGIVPAILTGRTSEAVAQRAAELGIEECHQGAGSGKLPVLHRMLDRLGLDLDEVAYMGDDLPDLPILQRVGLAFTVADAAPEVLDAAAWVAPSRGGHGAVRDVAEALLRARGEWEATLAA